MSYCRWSSIDYQCDIYCYESCYGGFLIHVANNRRIPVDPLPPKIELTPDNFDAWFARHVAVDEILRRSESAPIGLAHDGESFAFDTPGECADKLVELRRIGYRMPDCAIEVLREEAAEASTGPITEPAEK